LGGERNDLTQKRRGTRKRDSAQPQEKDWEVTNSTAPPIPDQVRAKLHAFLSGIRKTKSKGMVCPAGGLTTSLFLEGLLSDEEITGFLDNNETKHGTLVAGLPVKPLTSIAKNPPDFVILASMTFRKELHAQLLPLSRRYGFKLHDICDLPTSLSPVRFDTCLAPIPSVVLENLKKRIPSLISSRSRILLYPNHPLTLNLWLRGVFAHLDVRGIVDCHKQSAGTDGHGLTVYLPGQLAPSEADVILVTDPRYHSQKSTEPDPLAAARSLEIIDLCEGMTIESFRSEWAESIGEKLLANRMAEWPARKLQIWVPDQNLCDSLCAISAAREFARRHPNVEVQFPHLPEILRAYGDDLVRPGSAGYVVPVQPQEFLSEQSGSITGNYQGCYHLGLGMDFHVPPRPELPIIPPATGVSPRSFIVLHPGVEGLEPTPSREQLEFIVRTAPLPVVCIRDARTSRTIKGADYFRPGSLLEVLRLIQHAALVLTSRNVFSHIAAAYDVPSIVWVPGDGLDWHIDYPDWNHRRIRQASPEFIDRVEESIESLITQKPGSHTGPNLQPAGCNYTVPQPLGNASDVSIAEI
jgi:hypothetical protein